MTLITFSFFLGKEHVFVLKIGNEKGPGDAGPFTGFSLTRLLFRGWLNGYSNIGFNAGVLPSF